MRWKFITKIGEKKFGAAEPPSLVLLSGNPCTAMVSMRRDLQILRLRPKFWRRFFGGEQVLVIVFLGGIFMNFDRWESD